MSKELLAFSLIALSAGCGDPPVPRECVLRSKSYQPATSGSGISTKGEVIFTSTSEAFYFLCECEGDVVPVEVPSHLYYDFKEGDRVIVAWRRLQ